MKKGQIVLYSFLMAAVMLGWIFLFEGSGTPSNESIQEGRPRTAYTPGFDSYLDIIIFSSFSPEESNKISAEILKYTGKKTAIRILSANHISGSYSRLDFKSLDFYLSTLLTNTEKSTLKDVCDLLTSSLEEFKTRKDSLVTRVFLLGTLPEALSREDPALYCINNFTVEIKSLTGKQNVEYFTYINSEDTANPLDRDLINLLSGNNYKVSIIMTN